MEEIIRQIENQTEINFINIRNQIEVAELEAVFDGVNGSRYIFHNLCVKPKMRKQGYGKLLLDFAKKKTRELGGKILFLDFINDYKELRNWYFKNGFDFRGTVKYEHLPFTVGFAECYVGE